MNHDERIELAAVSRSVAIVVCLLSVAICLGYGWFRGQLPTWWRESGGGVPYVVFWACLGFVIFPQRRLIKPICLTAVSLAGLMEVLQLWHPPWLAHFRATPFGAALLGNQFHLGDFPPYLIGGLIGWALLTLVSIRFPIARNYVD